MEKQKTMSSGNQLPQGVRLVCSFGERADDLGLIAWSLDGRFIAAPSKGGSLCLWDVGTQQCIKRFSPSSLPATCAAFHPDGDLLAIGTCDGIFLTKLSSGKMKLLDESYGRGNINALAFSKREQKLFGHSDSCIVQAWSLPNGVPLGDYRQPGGSTSNFVLDSEDRILASVNNRILRLNGTGQSEVIEAVANHQSISLGRIAASPSSDLLAAALSDWSIVSFSRSTGLNVAKILEGHSDGVWGLEFSSSSALLASLSLDQTVRIWNASTGDCLAVLSNRFKNEFFTGLAFHPSKERLAVVGSSDGARNDTIYIYEFDVHALISAKPIDRHYTNAKVLLVGDTGVGKSGLGMVLADEPFAATDSTPGRKVWVIKEHEGKTREGLPQSRETLLWDLAGQPGYRVIHQLHLNEVSVALVVFDSRSETDPLAGVRHWERSLRLAQQRQGAACVPLRKFLVSARNDRGGITVSRERLEALLREYDFDGYFETSAKEGWQIAELTEAISLAIAWEKLPDVVSSQLLQDIRIYLVQVKQSGRLLAMLDELCAGFLRERPEVGPDGAELRAKFEACINRLDTRGLIRRLSFGASLLLQPELLDAYASALVMAAKQEPDGLGSIALEVALAGKFFVPPEHRIGDSKQEQLLLFATVEELVKHNLALQEAAEDGAYLVFPSQFNRDFEDAPEPKGRELAITFEGPVQSLYATLAVRLGHSGLFTTGRMEMWRNAAIFTARSGGRCGVFVTEFSEGKGRMIIFHEPQVSDETRFHFEEFVLAHTHQRALKGTIELVRFFICKNCGDPVPEAYVKRVREQGRSRFGCPCGAMVDLGGSNERMDFPSKIRRMESHADREREFESSIVSANGETATTGFIDWAGSDRATLAIVFTDVVGSTSLGQSLRDEQMNEVRRSHFRQSRQLISKYEGYEIKTIGDSFMVAFKCTGRALDYSLALHCDTGHQKVKIRAGIHVGPIHVEEDDAFGGTVNFASRVVGAIGEDQIWLSERAKEDLDQLGAAHHAKLTWKKHEGIIMKGFIEPKLLWELEGLGSA